MWCCPLHCAVLPLMLRGCVKPASFQNFQVCLGPVWFGAAWSGSVWFGAGLAAPGMWRLIRHSARLCTLMSGGWAGGMHGRRQVGTAAPLLSPPPTLAPLPMPGGGGSMGGRLHATCSLLAASLLTPAPLPADESWARLVRASNPTERAIFLYFCACSWCARATLRSAWCCSLARRSRTRSYWTSTPWVRGLVVIFGARLLCGWVPGT